MNMEPPALPCPVPEEQQPLNEYRELQESWFFSWAMLPRMPFLQRLGAIALLNWGLAAPVSAASFAPQRWLGQFILASTAGSLLLPTFVLIQLYLGWTYVRDRLKNPKVFYEESGWYDGQYWTKPSEVLVQDRLVVTYQIQPLLRRIEKALGLIALLLLGALAGWQLL